MRTAPDFHYEHLDHADERLILDTIRHLRERGYARAGQDVPGPGTYVVRGSLVIWALSEEDLAIRKAMSRAVRRGATLTDEERAFLEPILEETDEALALMWRNANRRGLHALQRIAEAAWWAPDWGECDGR